MAKKINKPNKILILTISIILVLVLASSTALFSAYYFDNYSRNPQVLAKAENFILMIGDGMGSKHLEVAKLYEGKELIITSKLGSSGEMITRSISFGATDSAASATAMATGKKVFNGRLSYSNGKSLTTIVELAQLENKKTGLVTTKSVTDATPAAFSSHIKSRRDEESIALQQIRESNLDVLFGLGQSFFEPYVDEIKTQSRDYCVSFQELASSQKDQIFCILPDDGISTIGNDYTLAILTSRALDVLSRDNQNGFFLMVEGAKIDTASHQKNIQGMINELISFDDAVGVALNFASNHQNTTVMVVADHETGKIKIPANAEAQDLSNDWFKSSSHTLRRVPYFIYGPGTGELPNVLDNSDVFIIISQLFGLS